MQFFISSRHEVIMKNYTRNPATVTSSWSFFFGAMLTIAFLVPVAVVAQTYSNPLPVPLLTAGTYGALASSGITGNATVNGDVGTISSSIGGTITATGINWNITDPAHNNQAQTDLFNALGDANSRTNDLTIPNALGGQTLERGVYTAGALDLASGTTLTLDAQFDPNAVFIIRSTSSLNINVNSTVSLINDAVWSNVFWYVGSDVTIFSGTTFNGIILAVSSITLNAAATQVTARLLANTGAITISSDVLPVELVSFTATAHSINADLNWLTATEVNNFGFDVQRSAVNDQQSTTNWTKIGFVGGAGTSNSPKEYSFTDKNLSSGKYSYRLKQIDRDGKFEYSQSVEVNIGQTPREFALMQNYPNPFNPTTKIQYNLASAAQVSLKVYNILGDEVATLVKGNQEAGNYAVSLNANEGALVLPSGVYFYRLEAGSFVSTKKLIVMK